jgi:hypothetical protein
MIKQINYSEFNECYEYHGNTVIELTRKQAGQTVFRDWMMFDSAKEAADYFYDNCFAMEA